MSELGDPLIHLFSIRLSEGLALVIGGLILGIVLSYLYEQGYWARREREHREEVALLEVFRGFATRVFASPYWSSIRFYAEGDADAVEAALEGREASVG